MSILLVGPRGSFKLRPVVRGAYERWPGVCKKKACEIFGPKCVAKTKEEKRFFSERKNNRFKMTPPAPSHPLLEHGLDYTFHKWDRSRSIDRSFRP